MRSKSIYAIGVTIAAMGLATLTLPIAAAAHDVAAEIEKVRIATLKYHDVKVALAEGFIPAPVRTEKNAGPEGPASLTGRLHVLKTQGPRTPFRVLRPELGVRPRGIGRTNSRFPAFHRAFFNQNLRTGRLPQQPCFRVGR